MTRCTKSADRRRPDPSRLANDGTSLSSAEAIPAPVLLPRPGMAFLWRPAFAAENALVDEPVVIHTTPGKWASVTTEASDGPTAEAM